MPRITKKLDGYEILFEKKKSNDRKFRKKFRRKFRNHFIDVQGVWLDWDNCYTRGYSHRNTKKLYGRGRGWDNFNRSAVKHTLYMYIRINSFIFILYYEYILL